MYVSLIRTSSNQLVLEPLLAIDTDLDVCCSSISPSISDSVAVNPNANPLATVLSYIQNYRMI